MLSITIQTCWYVSLNKSSFKWSRVESKLNVILGQILQLYLQYPRTTTCFVCRVCSLNITFRHRDTNTNTNTRSFKKVCWRSQVYKQTHNCKRRRSDGRLMSGALSSFSHLHIICLLQTHKYAQAFMYKRQTPPIITQSEREETHVIKPPAVLTDVYADESGWNYSPKTKNIKEKCRSNLTNYSNFICDLRSDSSWIHPSLIILLLFEPLEWHMLYRRLNIQIIRSDVMLLNQLFLILFNQHQCLVTYFPYLQCILGFQGLLAKHLLALTFKAFSLQNGWLLNLTRHISFHC